MNGLNIRYYCPVCKKEHNTVLGVTPYWSVEDRSLANIKCGICGKELLIEPIESKRLKNTMRSKFTDNIDRMFESGLYVNVKSKEYIVKDVTNRLIMIFGSVGVSKHFCEIEKYIELKLNSQNKTKGYSYVVDNSDITALDINSKYIIKKENAVYDYTICY